MKNFLKKIYNSIGRSYPRVVAVGSANHETLKFIEEVKPKSIAEIGVYKGHTTKEIIKIIDKKTKLYLFDFHDRLEVLSKELKKLGFNNFECYSNTYKYLDSYNTSLNKVWVKNKKPIFDYIFLDGAHTFPIDALTFFICDLLLQKGGYIDFDDYDWSLKSSPSQGPDVFPLTKKLYSDEQINEKGIKILIENYVEVSGKYEVIIKNKIYKKNKKLINMKNIPFFNYPYLYKSRKEKFDEIINDVCSRGAFILQKDLEDFEEGLKNFTGCNYALGVANGTDAIWLALMAAGIGEGDEVIFASHTYIATAGAIKFVGATPVPADCREDHMIDPVSVEKLITSKTKAIMPTQLNGRCCEMDTLLEIAKKYDLVIIEDAAQGLGARFNNESVCSFDLGGTISFYPGKEFRFIW